MRRLWQNGKDEIRILYSEQYRKVGGITSEDNRLSARGGLPCCPVTSMTGTGGAVLRKNSGKPGYGIGNNTGGNAAADGSEIRGALLRRKRKRGRFLLFLFLFLLLTLLAAGVMVAGTIHYLSPPAEAGTGEDILVNLPRGTSATGIAAILEREGIIRNAYVFRIYLSYIGDEASLMAGDYILNPSMDIDEIIRKLKAGDIYADIRAIVIPEGYNVQQVAKTLHEKGLADEQEFLQEARNPPSSLLSEFEFLKDMPGNTDYQLEGYLFPARYEFNADITVENILNTMLSTFRNRILTAENQKIIDESDLTLHEMLTIASIVEREAASGKERDIISSVFHNRLSKGMMFQSCATVQYVLGEVKEVLLYEDLKEESPYNTYLHYGLPPGPIASPGEESFRAALNPACTDYLFFVLKGDGSGEHYFGRSSQEHEQNRAKARRNAAETN